MDRKVNSQPMPKNREETICAFPNVTKDAGKYFTAYVKKVSYYLDKMIPGYRINSKHNHDLMTFLSFWFGFVIVGFIIAVFILGFVLYNLYPSECETPGKCSGLMWSDLAAFLSIYSIYLGFVVAQTQKVIDLASKRLGIVDLFSSEIVAVCAVIHRMNLLEKFNELYKNPKKWSNGKNAVDAKLFEARQENYSEIFNNNSHELGVLNSNCVKRVTRFYTYLKASRDATKSVVFWSEDYGVQERQRDVQEVIFLLALCLKNADLALQELFDAECANDHGDGESLSDSKILKFIRNNKDRSIEILKETKFESRALIEIGLLDKDIN